jgi:hypothetical protein
MRKMNIEEELVISLSKGIISGRHRLFSSREIGKGLNWKRFKELISYHELYPYLYPLIKDSSSLFPADVVDFLKNNYYYYVVHNQKLLREFLRISAAFGQAQIRVAPLKGAAFLQDIYFDIPARPMVDIDLLVEKADLPAAGKILLGLGFMESSGGLDQNYWLEKQCHIHFIKRESAKNVVYLDLHFSLDFKRKNMEILPQLWSRVREGMLSPEDMIFCLALHQRRLGKALCLKNVVDAGLILKKYQDTMDWGYLIEQAKSGRMRSALFFLFAQVRMLFDQDVRFPDLKLFCPNYFKRQLIHFFIKSNIFSDSIAKRTKQLYLKSHFLLYDDFLEPVSYILNIPQEQFAKFYNLDPYSRNTKLLYDNRFAYIFYKSVLGIFAKH